MDRADGCERHPPVADDLDADPPRPHPSHVRVDGSAGEHVVHHLGQGRIGQAAVGRLRHGPGLALHARQGQR